MLTEAIAENAALLMSDNGACAEEIHRGSYEDWHDIGREHIFESYGKPRANCSNTPFREYKHWVHEAGDARAVRGGAALPAAVGDLCRDGHKRAGCHSDSSAVISFRFLSCAYSRIVLPE